MKKIALVIAAVAAGAAFVSVSGKGNAATIAVSGVKDGESTVSCEFDADGDRVNDSLINISFSGGIAEIKSIFTRATNVTVPDTIEVNYPSGSNVYYTRVLKGVYPENGQNIQSVTLPDTLWMISSNAVGYSFNGAKFDRNSTELPELVYGGKISGFKVICNNNTTGSNYASANGFASVLPSNAPSYAGTVAPDSGIYIESVPGLNLIKWEAIDNCTSISVYRRGGDSKESALFTVLDGSATSCFDMSAGCDNASYYLIATVIENGKTQNIIIGNTSDDAVAETDSVKPRLTISMGSVTLNWNKNADAAGYIVKMDGEQVFDTQSGDVTTYTKTGLKDYEKHVFTVTPYNKTAFGATVNGEESDSVSTIGVDSILNSAKTDNRQSFTLLNKQKESTASSTVNLTDNDIAILEKFAKENFTDDMNDSEKLETTLNWINRNVNYARTSADWSKISGKTYVDSVFTYKTGQCAQYNGAMVSMMRYLGYGANLVVGYRGQAGGNYWQHLWGEVDINGMKYIIETGNYGSSGDWSFLLTPYERADGRYIVNGKNVQPESFNDYNDWGDWGWGWGWGWWF